MASNLLPSCASGRWQAVRLPNVPSLDLELLPGPDGGYLQMLAAEHDSAYGIWRAAAAITGGGTYRFTVAYRQRQVLHEQVSICALLSWYDRAGVLLERNYADQAAELPGGWKELSLVLETPRDATDASVDLVLRWAPSGQVSWRAPSLQPIEAREHCVVQIATTHYAYQPGGLEVNKQAMVDLVARAGAQGADLVCLSETPYGQNTRQPLMDVAQPIPGALTEAMAAVAGRHRCYVLFSMYERSGGQIYNTAVLLDRDGHVTGTYRKINLPLAEAENGVTPGQRLGVFKTDFGTIGVMICWDSVFPEMARQLAQHGAEIIFLPTYGENSLQQAARAKDNGVYVVVSGMYGPLSSRIIDPTGEIRCTVADGENGVCLAALDLDKRWYTHWLSLGPCNCEGRTIYPRERRTSLINLSDAW